VESRAAQLTRCPPRAGFLLCAEHAQQLGGESPLSSLMVVKD